MLVFGALFQAGTARGAPVVLVEGSADCPSPDAVSRELSRIVTAPAGVEPTERAFVGVEGSEIDVMLTTVDGEVLGRRRLPADGDCDERARAAAVVLAAWITDAHPEYLSELPREPPPTTLAPSPAPTAASPDPPAAPPNLRPTRPESSSPAPPQPAPRALEPRASRAFRVTASLAAGVEVSGETALAVDFGARVAPRREGFGGAVFALLASGVDRPLGTGEVRSWRWPLGVSGLFRVPLEPLVVDFELGPMLGLLRLEGRGFSTTDSAVDAVGGLHAGAVLGSNEGVLRPFVGSRIFYWVGSATATASAPEVEVDLPVWEGLFIAGVAFAPWDPDLTLRRAARP